jgi:hypothetical protein
MDRTQSSRERCPAREFLAPLDGAPRGRLVFSGGTPDLTVCADRSLGDLAQVRFDGPRPRVRAAGGEVVVSYPGLGLLGWLAYALRPARAQVALNPAIPWAFDFRDSVHRLTADLRELALAGVEVHGGVGRAELWLPRPTGTVGISVAKGVGGLTIHRPTGTPLRLSVRGAISSLSIDGEELGTIDGGIRRETAGWPGAPDRLDVAVAGGVSHLAITD